MAQKKNSFSQLFARMNVDNDEDFLDDDIYGDLEDDEVAPPEPRSSLFSRRSEEPEEEESRPAPRSAKVTPMRQTRRNTSAYSRPSGMEVHVVRPTQFDESRDIIETMLSGRTVFLNMEGLDMGLAQRIIDIVSGACLATNGRLQKASNYIFIVTPDGVDISGDPSALLESYDIAGLHTGF